MRTSYGMDTCIETNELEIIAFGMEVYSNIPGICKNLEYVRHIPDICLTYDTIRIPDGQWRCHSEGSPGPGGCQCPAGPAAHWP